MIPEVKHLLEEKRFEVEFEGERAYIEYKEFDGGLNLYHTWVPKAIGGRGIAAALVKSALKYIEEEGLKVRGDCSYVAAYLERKKEEYNHLME